MARAILFAVGEAGSAEYLVPLWRRWLEKPPEVSWRVAASPVARKRIAAAKLRGLPLVAGDIETASALADRLGNWKPDLVVASASHAAVEAAAIALARKLGLTIIRFVDTWYGYRDRLSEEAALDLPDRLLVIDESAVEQAVGEGLPRDILAPVGQPAWEQVVALPPADPRRVTFVSQPIARNYGTSLGYTETSSWNLLLETALRRPDLIAELVFAPHPDDDMPPPAEDRLVRVARGQDSLKNSGTVVGMFSSLMIEALLAGRRVVSLQPGATGPDRGNMSRRGFVTRATSAEELVAALDALPPDLAELRAALKGSCERLERALLAS